MLQQSRTSSVLEQAQCHRLSPAYMRGAAKRAFMLGGSCGDEGPTVASAVKPRSHLSARC